MIGPCGYGRYNDDMSYVGCPRAQSDMTPCIARDGHLALSDRTPAGPPVCVACGANPHELIKELNLNSPPSGMRYSATVPPNKSQAADILRDVVREATEPPA